MTILLTGQEYSRFVPIQGSINFRDFGGYVTASGQKVNWRKLFRCGSLSMLSAAGEESLAALKISVICDLRREDEAAMSPTPDHAPFNCRVAIPIAQGSSQMLRDSINDKAQTAQDRVRFMTEITRELARDHHLEYQQLFEHLLNAQGGFLLHCSAGKDRTGFGAALILASLGVSEKLVMSDYMLTNEAICLREFMESRMAEFYGADFDKESLQAVGGVHREYLQAALNEIRDSHGSLEGYLQAIGIGTQERKELQRRYLNTI